MIKLEDVCLDFSMSKKKSFRAVQHVNLHIKEGQTLALVGESGSGKSSLAKMLIGIHKPSAGQITTDLKPHEKQYIFQDPYSSLNPRMRVGKIIAEPMIIKKCYNKERVNELLDLVGLPQASVNKYPHEFSGGERQRIAIARSLSLNPKLLILDEPTSALDLSIRAQILALLADLQERLGLTYLFISHDLSLVKQIARDVAVMYRGEIVELGLAAELFHSPKHPYTQALLASIPRLHHTPALKILGEQTCHTSEINGCPFAPRCPKAVDLCQKLHPSMHHNVRCHLYE
ncbi:MAG: putative D,D-dipeptide transport ATP-binding protein DdpF [Chlamydiia bacterium]|nr:putative D,D-dipeptide transport ATP-binding protein DdpF [Chlamydiia bacterium]MCH9615562.1 putative D,D-dipeptide transport ATP-binding protein DdpF [Chlamydiia bacterium]MCH9629217.1 putative D,D-dipeptide transport ATP-binding protein DdpF [Chlamydiia bacterium]